MKKFIAILLVISVPAISAQYNIRIPTDSKANYTVIEKNSRGELRTIITKREGVSGVSYSERIYDCTSGLVKYLGTGDTLEQMKSSSADPNMTPIVDQSIAFYIGQEACK